MTNKKQIIRNMKYLIFLTSLISLLQAQSVITGRVIDKNTGEPIPFAGVGIKGKNLGTLSNEAGYFNLVLKDIGSSDSLKVSSIGYKSRSISIVLAQQFQNESVYLTPESVQLNEVVVKPGKTYTVVLGNKKYNKNVQCSFQGADNNFLGVEAAIKANNKKGREIWFENFNFYLNKNTVNDSISFRLNLYKIDKKGLPGENILKKPIVFTVYKQTGIISVDLKSYLIYTNDDFFISLECLSNQVNSNNLSFSGSIIGPAYFKLATFAEWEKISLMGLDFNVTVSYRK
jgi:hypothetical protein